MSKFYSNIDDYFESIDFNRSVSLEGLDELLLRLHANTNISIELCNIIVRLFFQETRNIMLRGEILSINKFGSFYISSPKVSGNKSRIFAKFEPYKILLGKLNE